MTRPKSEPKFRPQVSLPEIEAICTALHITILDAAKDSSAYVEAPYKDSQGNEIFIPVEVMQEVYRKLQAFKFKASVGINSPAYVVTQDSRGRPSNARKVKDSFIESENVARSASHCTPSTPNTSKTSKTHNTHNAMPRPIHESFSIEETAYNKYCAAPETCSTEETELAVLYKAENKKESELTEEERKIVNAAFMKSFK